MSLFFWVLQFVVLTQNVLALTTTDEAIRVEKDGGLVLGAKQAEISEGEVYKSVLVLWGEVEIKGQVDEVVVVSGKVTFHPGSKLVGNLVVMGGAYESLPGASVDPQSVVLKSPGPIWRAIKIGAESWREHAGVFLKVIGLVATVLLQWIMGCILFGFFPRMREVFFRPLQASNFLAAFLGLTVIPILLLLLILSVIGLLVVPLYIAGLFVSFLLSHWGASFWVGHRILPAHPGTWRPASFLLGLLVLQFLWSVSISWVWLLPLGITASSWGGLLRLARSKL